MDLDVLTLTPERMGDLATVINPRRNPKHCWCLAYRLTGREAQTLATDDTGAREARMRELAAGHPAPGLIAYRDGEPVGWVGIGPRHSLPRLARSRVIPKVDDVPVWSVVCLVVRTGSRRQGITAQLLEGVDSYAVAQGAPALEAYPVEPAPGRRVDTSFAYVGTTTMFERAGYLRVRGTDSTSDGLVRWLMRKDLTGPGRAG